MTRHRFSQGTTGTDRGAQADAFVVGGARSAEVVAPAIPAGLQRLLQIGEILAGREWPELLSLRVVMTVPTTRLAGLALALGATRAIAPCDAGCGHTQLDGVRRLAACYVDRHLQDREAWCDSAGIHVGQSTFTRHIESVHRLPNGFPERDRVPRNINSRSQIEIEDLASALGEDMAVAGFQRSSIGAHPVIYFGGYGELRQDIKVASRTPPLAGLHPVGRLAPGENYDSWFRHPTIVVRDAPLPGHHPWLSEVRPRLVVRCGHRALLKPMAGIWDAVPHVVLLSRRSPSSVEAVEAIRGMSWRPVSSAMLDDKLAVALRPGVGLEIGCFCEPTGRLALTQEEAEDDEW